MWGWRRGGGGEFTTMKTIPYPETSAVHMHRFENHRGSEPFVQTVPYILYIAPHFRRLFLVSISPALFVFDLFPVQHPPPSILHMFSADYLNGLNLFLVPSPSILRIEFAMHSM